MTKQILAFLSDESGATAIEYALIASFVSVACIVGVMALSGSLQATFTNIGNILGTMT